jgi:hypothetical protein
MSHLFLVLVSQACVRFTVVILETCHIYIHAHMLAAISRIDTYMFHPPHDEWNICIYMVAAASHIHANLQKQANPRFLFFTGPIGAPGAQTRSALASALGE